MQFLEFKNQLSNYPLFSLQDVRKILSRFSYRQLDRWEKKGYLKKIKRGFYSFDSQEVTRNFLFYTANKIYAPSYVSLETALKFYELIPEEIFQITSVGTKKIGSFETDIGSFSYRHIKPGLYWGYRLVPFGKQKILIAELEKAVLDYLYIHPNLKTSADFEGMRINVNEFKSQIDLDKFQRYLVAFGKKRFSRRAEVFLNTIKNAHT